MSPVNPSVMYSPPLDGYPSSSNQWYPPSNTSQSAMPILMPMNHSDQMQLQHRLSVNVTDHYEWTTNPTHFHPGGYPTATANSSNFDTMSLNGSLSSGTSTNDSSPYPLLTPMPTMFFNQYPPAPVPSVEQQQQQQYFQPPVFYPPAMSPRLITEPGAQQPILSDPSSTKFVGRLLSSVDRCFVFRFLPGQGPLMIMVS